MFFRALLPQRTAGGLPLRGCFCVGAGELFSRRFCGWIFSSAGFCKARTFFLLVLRVKRDFHSTFCPTAGGGFFLRVLPSRQIFPSADFYKGKDIFPAAFAGQAGFFRSFATRQGGFPLPDFSKWRGIFPVDFAGQAGFSLCLLPNGGRRVFPPGFSSGFYPLGRFSPPLILRRF